MPSLNANFSDVWFWKPISILMFLSMEMLLVSNGIRNFTELYWWLGFSVTVSTTINLSNFRVKDFCMRKASFRVYIRDIRHSNKSRIWLTLRVFNSYWPPRVSTSKGQKKLRFPVMICLFVSLVIWTFSLPANLNSTST